MCLLYSAAAPRTLAVKKRKLFVNRAIQAYCPVAWSARQWSKVWHVWVEFIHWSQWLQWLQWPERGATEFRGLKKLSETVPRPHCF